MATFEIKMPKLGESITEGTIISWSVKVGDTVEEDDVLFEVSTAKVSAEIPSPVEGKVKQLLFNEGDTVAVGTVVAILEIEGEGEDNGAQPETSEATQPKEKVPAPASEELSKNSQEEDRWYSPVVLQLAKAAGVSQDELDHIPGTDIWDVSVRKIFKRISITKIKVRKCRSRNRLLFLPCSKRLRARQQLR